MSLNFLTLIFWNLNQKLAVIKILKNFQSADPKSSSGSCKYQYGARHYAVLKEGRSCLKIGIFTVRREREVIRTYHTPQLISHHKELERANPTH
jgi:hypothetical protein